jgi:DNA-binding MarR family transcriptional regulator
MITPRLSRLQKRILHWLMVDHHRTNGVILSSHEELVKALGGYKGNVSRSLQTLETRGWIIIGRSPGGHAHHLKLTVAGQQKAAGLAKVIIKRLSTSKQ